VRSRRSLAWLMMRGELPVVAQSGGAGGVAVYGATVRARPGSSVVTIVLGAVALLGGLLFGVGTGSASASTAAASVRVTGLSRHHEPTWGGDWITVHGSGFTQSGRRAVAAVYFGRFRASYTLVIDDHTIRALDPEVDGRRKVVWVVVRQRNGHRSAATAASRFVFTVPTMRTPAHNGLSTLQSRALAAKVIRHVSQTRPVPLARRSATWRLAEGITAVRRARRWLGMPYSWGGGNTAGPTLGSPFGDGLLGRFDATFRGFDCSGLTLFAWAPYRTMAHFAATQHAAAGRFHPTLNELEPGDLLFFSVGGPVIDHVVIYAGRGRVIQAPESGHQVEVSSLTSVLRLEPRHFGATRPASKGRGTGPRITSISPSQGTSAGGETVTIRGRNLLTTSRILFGTVATYSFTVVSASEVRVRVPAEGSGTVAVRLGNAWGLSPRTNADLFTYAAPTT
jgi:cell wall-associated NlpC family hydrolase